MLIDESISNTITFSQVFSSTGTTAYTLTDSLSFSQTLAFTSNRQESISNSLTLIQSLSFIIPNHFYPVNSLAFAQSLTLDQTKGLQSEIEFSQNLCMVGSRQGTIQSTLTFNQSLTFFINDVDDARNNLTPISNIPLPMSLTGPIRAIAVHNLVFGQSIEVLGGYIYDYSCYPPRLIYNDSDGMFWEDFSDLDWFNMSDADWMRMS